MTGDRDCLQELFAVTMTSVYHVTAKGSYRASAVKIALKGDSGLPIGSEIVGDGQMLAITSQLQAFIPEKYGLARQLTGYETSIEMVNTAYWGAHSSPIIALFKTREEAMKCFNNTDLQPCDARWLASTRTVLEAIGDNHPSFSVCHFRDLALIRE